MLMHQGIGLDRFNSLTRSRAVHAMFECCCNVTWAAAMADGRPYADRAALLAKADMELLALSGADLDRALDVVAHETIPGREEHGVTELARITRARIEDLLGPEGGWPEY